MRDKMKKNIHLAYWRDDYSGHTGYKDNSPIPSAILGYVIFELFNKGYNIQLRHGEIVDLLVVDKGNFQQR